METIQRSVVHDDIRDRLKEFITANDLQPGDRLPGEELLASQLGVGRPAVREALRALEAVGAVETRKGVGRFVGSFGADSFVRNFTTDALLQSFSQREIFETRCLLEIAAVPQAVARLTDKDLDEIQTLLEGMRDHISAGELYLDEDIGMHRCIMRHVDNRLIAAMLDAVYALTTRLMSEPGWSRPQEQIERSTIDLAEHVALSEAVMERDGRLAQQRLMTHFDSTARRLGFTPSWHVLFDNGG